MDGKINLISKKYSLWIMNNNLHEKIAYVWAHLIFPYTYTKAEVGLFPGLVFGL